MANELRPEYMACEWPMEPKLQRLRACLIYLALSDMLTAGEINSIKKRIKRFGRSVIEAESRLRNLKRGK